MTKVLMRIACVILLTGLVASSRAQAPATTIQAKTPQELAALVLQKFASGSADEFSSVVPDPGAQAVVLRAIKGKAERQGNLGEVIWQSSDQAVLLLTGTVVAKNSGEETTSSRGFSGLYEAAKSDGTWSITKRMPIDEDNHILSQAVRCTIVPGQKIDVQDDVTISVGGAYGFAVRLNDRAKLSQVKLDDKTAKYKFGGGVLWVDMPRRPRAELSLEYSLAAESHDEGPSAPTTNVATGPPAYGEFLNVDVWMPLFDFDSANDTAPISITARIPAAYYLTTSIPQKETVSDGTRIVQGHTDEPEFTLTLIFDRDWHPTVAKVGDIEFGTFLTAGFHWTPAQLEEILRKEYKILDPRFGPPQSHYIALAEERGIGVSGFRFRANDLVVSGGGGGKVLLSPKESAASEPNAPLPHEISHGWTMQASGPAANTLREGWATFCEWLYIGEEYDDVERDIWETAHNYYLLGGHDGVRSILGNPGNGSIHYVKGAWIFHMLEEVMGQSRFDRGMREYIEIPRDQPAGYEQFIKAMSDAEGHDMTSFVMPWLSGKYIPDINGQINGSNVILTQTQPDEVFDLPLDVALTTSSGKTVERTVQLAQRSDTLNVTDLGTVTNVRIDPHHEFLLQRHFGEKVHFELRAPDAKAVALSGNFTLKPVPAQKAGDVWTLDLPMSEGRYSWAWQVDGKTLEGEYNGQPASGVRVVEPLERLETPLPK